MDGAAMDGAAMDGAAMDGGAAERERVREGAHEKDILFHFISLFEGRNGKICQSTNLNTFFPQIAGLPQCVTSCAVRSQASCQPRAASQAGASSGDRKNCQRSPAATAEMYAASTTGAASERLSVGRSVRRPPAEMYVNSSWEPGAAL